MILKFSPVKINTSILRHITFILAQDKESILPVATLSIALYVLCRSRPASDVAPEVAILLSAL